MLCEEGVGYEDQFKYDIQHIESIDSLSKVTFQNIILSTIENEEGVIIRHPFPSFFDRTNKYLYLHLTNKSNRLFLIPYFYRLIL
mgnify:CR=1 FL=1